MSAFYTDLRSEAHDLLTEFGQTVVFTREQEGPYDPATGSYSISTTVVSVTAAKLPVKTGVSAFLDQRMRDPASYDISDMAFLYASAADFGSVVPKVNDKVTVQGVTWTILGAAPLDPAGINTVWSLSLVKS